MKESQQPVLRYWQEFIERTYPSVRELKLPSVPAESNKYVVMVEPRSHPHLEYVLRNVLYFLGPGWGLQLFVGQKNQAYVESIVNDWGEVQVCQINVDDFTEGQYNQLKKGAAFWELILGETVLWVEPDCLLRRAGIDEFQQYDYIGAPWKPSLAISPHCRVANGGLSLRKRSAMIEVASNANTHPAIIYPEDVFFCLNMHLAASRYHLPSVEKAMKFAVESMYYPAPLGIHKPWKYLGLDQLVSLLSSIDYPFDF